MAPGITALTVMPSPAQRLLAAVSDDERAIGAAGMSTVRLTGSAAGAAAAAAVANLAGFAEGFAAQSASHAATWLFVSMLPFAALGALAAWRVGSRER